jgi:putative sterol carrier protein
MPHLFPSQEWAKAYKDAINTSASYKAAGKDWAQGVVAMVVKAEPSLDIQEDTAMWLDIHLGECRDCRLIPASEAQEAPFVIVADYARWKQVIRRELDPIKGMMQGKLKLTKGHMPTIVKHVNASKALVESTADVDTTFRDENEN